MTSGPLIQLEHLAKVYRTGAVDIHALRGVSLQIPAGQFVALMGASGSGKSTLMNLLGCLDRATSGRYSLDGVDVSELEPRDLAEIRNQRIGFVFQNFNLLARTSALENVELPLLYRHPKFSTTQREEKAMQALEMVGLSDRAEHHPTQLSGGQQQRVAIARALINEPAVLLADEPTGNLDSRTSVEILGVFQRLNRQGLTVIMVTHEPDVAQYCQRNISLRDGRIISDAAVAVPREAAAELRAMPEPELVGGPLLGRSVE